MSQPELRLQIAVVQFLRLSMPDGVLWWHTPNGGSRDAREAAKLKAMGTTPGVPDLLFYLPNGQLGAIELKADKGRITEAQDAWMRAAERNGARVAVCKTMEAVVEALTEWLRPAGLQLRGKVAA